ncbi:hypothetical protein CfE428DRAFT_3676 [Chthoniobacter flavus Ellin428]|uniref:Uncharacterized protein n=1 Tax=Chthoniobacter flavus Ellin428 TaxID=497964 RepID=B4D438_9BACT|nr:hypothetical protein CfE428DRAFT_3676 [Chthoniobacter flavus Ellin428]
MKLENPHERILPLFLILAQLPHTTRLYAPPYYVSP